MDPAAGVKELRRKRKQFGVALIIATNPESRSVISFYKFTDSFAVIEVIEHGVILGLNKHPDTLKNEAGSTQQSKI